MCVSNATLNEKWRPNVTSATALPCHFGTLRPEQDLWSRGAFMLGPLRAFVIATAFALPTAAAAQLQVNQNFVAQGPAPSFGPLSTVQSGDAPPNGNVAGAVGPVVTDPLNANTLFVGTPWGGIWKTTNGGTTWTPLTDKQATLSIASLAYDPTDPTRNTLIAGTGLTANGAICSDGPCRSTGSGGLRNGLLYTQDGGNTWTSLGAAALANQSIVGVAARGSVMVAATYEISGFPFDRHVGALYRSTDGGAGFTQISGAAGTGLPNGPVSSIVGDPNNPNRLYAAVTAPNAASNATTAIFVSNDTGATWTPVFGAAQSGGTIQAATQTVIKIATGPGGAIAAGVVNLNTERVTGLFWSGNSGGAWTQLPTPALNDGSMQAPLNFAIAIDPTNKNLVYVTGDAITTSPFTLPAFRIDASTLMFSSITDAGTGNGSTVHADSRAITFDANGRMIVTSDGTIYARTNPQSDAGVWTQISGNISAFEVRNVAYDAVGKRLITAAQDTGVTIQATRNTPRWNAVQGADGINAFVNDVTLAATGRSVFYANTQGLGFPARIIVDAQGNFVSPNTSGWGFGATVTCNGIDCAAAVIGSWFNSPWVHNRVDPTRMAFGGNGVFVTQDTLTGAQGPAANIVDLTLTDLGRTLGASVTKIAYGTRDNPNMLVAGTQGGLLFQSTTATANSLVPVLPYSATGGLTPTGIVLDPRSQFRYFVADNTNLFGTTTQGGAFTNLTGNLPAGIIRPTALEFISNNGVDALLVGGLNNVANAQSTVAVADSDTVGVLSNWRPFGTGLPNSQVNALAYNPTVDVLAVGTFGRGVFALYDVTSYFPQATVLQFGLANNDSQPVASFLTDGTTLSGTGFARPLNKYGTGTLTIAGNATYTGGTTIFGGALQLGTGGASGSILGDVAFCSDGSNPLCDPSTNKLLAFNRSDVYAFAGTISGPGQVQQIGPGTTILTANNSYTGGTVISAGTLQVTNNNSVGTGAVTLGGGIFQAGANGLNFSNPFNVNTTGGTVDTNGNTLTLAGVIADGNGPGALTKMGTGTLTLSAANTYSGGTTVIGGLINFKSASNFGSGTITLNGGGLQWASGTSTDISSRLAAFGAGGATFDTNGNNVTLASALLGTGGLTKIGAGALTLTGTNTYSGATTISGGTLQLGNGGASGSIVGDVTNNGIFAINRSDTFTFGGVISGSGAFAQIGAGTTILTAANTYSGGTAINSGVLAVAADANLGAASGGLAFGGGTLQFLSGFTSNRAVTLNAGGGTFDTNGNTATLAGTISGAGGLTKIGAGALTLTGTNTYSSATTVNAGTLFVNGSIANSAVTVNSGATLAGIGTVGATTINSGGIFAPGTSPGTMTVQGNLAFQSGALYLVQVNPSTASSTNVTAGGSATLAGTVNAAFASGSYVSRTYTILSAAGGLNGTTFNNLTTTNLPAGFTSNLSYTPTNVILNLTATLGQPSAPGGPSGPNALGTGGLSINQLNVANSLNTFFNNGGALPPNFVTIFGLTGGNLANALSQLSGEAATGAQKVAFQLTDQFLNVMLDPFVDGRSGVGGGADHPALGFAPERETMPPEIALAYASMIKEPRAPLPPVYEPRWTVWGGAYGGSNRTSGDIAIIGSHDLSARTVGFAAGLDYHLTSNTVVGFALAGGGTDWSLSQGLGGGKSDAFQAGIYGATKYGPAYLAAAFAFANHWMSTDRLAVGDHLTADFNAQSYGGRLEGGYRFGMPYGGITPYAAIQSQSFHTPGFTETGVIPNGFALAFDSRDATDTRSELGARFDRVLAVYSNAVLALRGRVAWAHDWVSDPTLTPLFQALPGASFVVNGAVLPQNSALASAGGELRFANGVTLLAKFDGEFASHSSTYAGTGTLRYRW
jgi:autotransporter-associated beta strand protein